MMNAFINFLALLAAYLFGCIVTHKHTDREIEGLKQERDDLEWKLFSERKATRIYKQRMSEYVDVLLKKLKAKR